MRRSLLLAVSVLVAATAACGATSPGPAAPPAPNVVVLKNIAFNPATVTIHAGQQVIWRFEDGNVPHDVTGDPGSGLDSAIMSSGTYTHTFPAAGTFNYRCTIHSGMDGTVVVTQ